MEKVYSFKDTIYPLQQLKNFSIKLVDFSIKTTNN